MLLEFTPDFPHFIRPSNTSNLRMLFAEYQSGHNIYTSAILTTHDDYDVSSLLPLHFPAF